MQRPINRMMIFFLAAALILLPLGASVSAKSTSDKTEQSAEKMAADLVLVRPIGIVSTITGCVVYVTSLPFSIPGGNKDKVWETMVKKPARFTFKRPLGDF